MWGCSGKECLSVSLTGIKEPSAKLKAHVVFVFYTSQQKHHHTELRKKEEVGIVFNSTKWQKQSEDLEGKRNEKQTNPEPALLLLQFSLTLVSLARYWPPPPPPPPPRKPSKEKKFWKNMSSPESFPHSYFPFITLSSFHNKFKHFFVLFPCSVLLYDSTWQRHHSVETVNVHPPLSAIL